jgi:hypothetical protein
LFIFLFFANEPRKTRPGWRSMLIQMDLVGLSLIVGAVVCYILAMQWGGISKAWNSAAVIGTLVAFGVFVLLFIVAQWYQGENAMVHSRIIRRRTIAVGCLFSFLQVSLLFGAEWKEIANSDQHQFRVFAHILLSTYLFP